MKAPPWLLVDPGVLAAGAVITLPVSEARHATGPLRLRDGDAVVLADGGGRTAAARLSTVGRAAVAAEVLSVESAPPPEGEGVTVALAVIEAKAMDRAVQKCVEIGVRRLQPIVTDRSQAGRRESSKRSAHLRRIASQALKQCRRPWGMQVMDAQSLADFLVQREGLGGVVADAGGVSISCLPPTAGRALVIGPEGGFSTIENESFLALGWPRLRLGTNILRAETAAVVGGAMMVAREEGLIAAGISCADGLEIAEIESRHE